MDIFNLCVDGDFLQTIVNVVTFTVALDFISNFCYIISGLKGACK